MSRFEFWAASLAPYDGAGRVDVSRIPEQAEHLRSIGVAGAFVNGTSGEFPFLTIEERVEILEAWVDARPEGFALGVQVGGLPLEPTRELAAHAAGLGVDLVSSVAPYYGQASSVSHTVQWLASVAQAADGVPFCYYQIPSMTGSTQRPSEILTVAKEEIPTLTAVKFTDEDLMELDAIQQARPDVRVYFGRDELLPAALALGAGSAIGSLYNGMAPLAHAAVDAFDSGEVQRAYALHKPFRDVARVATGPGFVKELMNELGPDVGPARGVWGSVTAADRAMIDRIVPSLREAIAEAQEAQASANIV
ncbi:N-acetylneuraminate lyase [Microbacterium natoriense]|uniref:N-acetylneuraminate lyase n=1 Tax=Microbacterium natoriense TaxID=284570 RepID=A0AAW8EWZ9_9MICO|nr:dihydrodipicolinate synthase family protein [Microbacterium natoriense]MDQ0648043.1 N-acetylneuraminate lyase [Microbacterium natoriense]